MRQHGFLIDEPTPATRQVETSPSGTLWTCRPSLRMSVVEVQNGSDVEPTATSVFDPQQTFGLMSFRKGWFWRYPACPHVQNGYCPHLTPVS
jgi:hypothetical protein